jgi:hypothetical protein
LYLSGPSPKAQYRVAQIFCPIRNPHFSFPDQPIPVRFFAIYCTWREVLFSLWTVR